MATPSLVHAAASFFPSRVQPGSSGASKIRAKRDGHSLLACEWERCTQSTFQAAECAGTASASEGSTSSTVSRARYDGELRLPVLWNEAVSRAPLPCAVLHTPEGGWSAAVAPPLALPPRIAAS